MSKRKKRVIAFLMAFTMVVSICTPSSGMTQWTNLANKVSAAENYATTGDASYVDDVEEVTPSEETIIEEEVVRVNAQDPTALVNGLTGVTIGADKDSNGAYIVESGETYSLRLSFGENSQGYQFVDDNTRMIYDLPAGLESVNAVNKDGLTIKVTTGGGVYNVEGNRYTIEGGKLILIFNDQDPNFDKLKSSANAEVRLDLTVQFSDEVEEIDFGNGIKVQMNVITDKDIEVNKTANYSSYDGKIYYTVTVKATGKNNNVVVSDTITGSALTLDPASITYNPNTLTGLTTTDKGFTGTFPTLTNGQTATITYAATIDYTKITDGGTVEQTGNTVKAKSDESEDGDEADSQVNNITYTPQVSKGHGDGTVAADGTVTIPWTVTLNSDCHFPINGKTLTDSIDTASQEYMKYSGTGITVEKYDTEGNLAGTETIPWANLTASSDTGFTYTVPESDTTPYKYVITYTTDAKNDSLKDVDVKNTATFDGQGSDGYYKVENNGDQLISHKDGVSGKSSPDATYPDVMNYTYTFNVIANRAYDTCYVEDSFTGKYFAENELEPGHPQGLVFDHLIDGSLHIDGLVGNESYTIEKIEDDAQSKFIVTFYKDAEHTETGLTTGTEDRTITLTYQSKVDELWYMNSNSTDTRHLHQNNATVHVGSDSSTASHEIALFPVKPVKVDKAGEDTGWGPNVNGNTYPLYHFSIKLEGGLKEGDVIKDIFDTSILSALGADSTCHIDGNDVPMNNLAPKLKGGNQWACNNVGDVSITPTAEGADFTITELPTNDGFFVVEYYLYVNSKEALDKLRSDPSGKYTLTNKAQAGDSFDTAEVVFSDPSDTSKTLLQEANKDNDYVAKYQIDINPDKLTYGTEETLEVIDNFTGLRVKEDDTIQITTDPADKADEVKYVKTTSSLVFTIPNSTHVTITYTGHVVGEGNINYSNELNFIGHTKNVSRTVSIDSDEEGTASNPGVYIYKHTFGDSGAALSGAVFRLDRLDDGTGWTAVKDKNGNEVTVQTAGDGKVLLEGDYYNLGWVLDLGVTYRLVEVVSPAGYAPEEPTIFVIEKVISNSTNSVYESKDTIYISNMKENFHIIKVDKNDQTKLLPGATYKLVSSEGEDVYSREATSGDDGMISFSGLVEGTYYLTETKAPDNYKVDNNTYTVTVSDTLTISSDNLSFSKVTTNGIETYEAKVSDEPEEVITKEVTINKYDITNSKEVVGATLEVTDTETGDSKGTWESKANETWTISELVPNRVYALTETVTPNEYNPIASTVYFVVDEDGNVKVVNQDGSDKNNSTDAEVRNNVLLINNTAILGSIEVTKSYPSGSEVKAVTIGLYQDASANTPYMVNGVPYIQTLTVNQLKAGDKAEFTALPIGTYYVYEIINGSAVNIDKTVTIDGLLYSVTGTNSAEVVLDSATTKTVTITNTQVSRSVTINKYDIAGSEEVVGAVLEVKDTVTNTSIGTWESKENETWTISTIIPGRVYSLEETTTPEGYETITTTVYFVVDATGNVTVTDASGNEKTDSTDAVVTDDGILLINNVPKIGSIEVTKSYPTGSEVKAVTIGLYQDPEGKAPYKVDGVHYTQTLSVDQINAGEKATFTDLPYGTYFVFEIVDGNPVIANGNVTIDGSLYVVSGVEEKEVVIDSATPRERTITNTQVKKPVTINKYDIANSEEVVGAVLEVTDTVTGDSMGDWESKENETWTINDLIPGRVYSLEETTTPDGYETITTTVYFVVDGNGNVTVTDADGNAKLGSTDAVVTNDGILLINNAPKKVSYVPVIKKIYEGKTLIGGEFTFVVYNADESYNPTAVAPVISGSNDANGNVTFSGTGNIEYTKAGTYYYIIQENEPYDSNPNITYDNTAYGLKVVVTMTNDGLAATPYYINLFTNETVDKAEFVNKYSTEVTINKYDIANSEEVVGAVLEVTDTVTGNSMGDWESKENETWTITGLVPGRVYSLEETTTPDGYETITTTVYFVVDEDGKVTVTDADGNEKTDSTDATVSADGILLINDTLTVYEPVDFIPEATKKATGFTLTADAFEFICAETNEDYEVLDGTTPQTAKNAANGKVTFDKYTFTEEGEYYFQIIENVPTEVSAGYTYSDETYNIKVTVTKDKETKKLVKAVDIIAASTGTSTEEALFENILSDATPVEVQPEAKKEFTKGTLEAEQFEFTLTQVDENGDAVNEPYTDSTKNKADGTVTFKSIKLSVAGEYFYKIVEKIPTDADDTIVYSDVEYIYHVTVTKNTETNAYEAETEILKGQAVADSMVFENVQLPGPTDIELEATKSTVGFNLEADKFTFTLVETDNTFTSITNGITSNAMNDANGNVVFDKIEYTEVGTHFYKIIETYAAKNVPEGYVYSKAVYGVKVEVTVDEATNTLKATPTYYSLGTLETPMAASEVEKAEFVNTALVGAIEITKTFGQYTTRLNYVTVRLYKDKDATIPATYLNGNPVGDIDLSPYGSSIIYKTKVTGIPFGTYYIYEIDKDDNPIIDTTKAAHVSYMTYKVTYSAESVEVNDTDTSNPATFGVTNTQVTPAHVEVNGTKTFENADLESDMFSFKIEEVEEVDGSFVAKNGGFSETVSNENGEFEFAEFAEIGFAEEGTYYYQVTEVIPDDPELGVTYDDSVYLVTVVVTYNSSLGSYEATKTITGPNTTIEFTNTYTAPTEAEFTPAAEKIATGFELSGDQFSFSIVELDDDGDPIDSTKVVKKNAIDGSVTFDTITYDEEGVYYYYICEEDPANPITGYTYSDAEYLLIVTVVLNDDNELVATGEYYNIDTENKVDVASFENIYSEATPTFIQPVATKTAENFDLLGNDFEFVITQTDDNFEPMTDGYSETVSNNDEGDITFSKINFAEEGTYYFTISEVKPADASASFTYSEEVYKVTVEVTKNTSNALVPEVQYINTADETVTDLEFVNTYTEPGPTDIELEATKIATGFDLEGDDFEFTLVEVDDTLAAIGTPVTATNDAEGNVTFAPIDYTAEGTFIYMITENVPDTAEIGWTYSAARYIAVVEVTLNASNVLEAWATYYTIGTATMPMLPTEVDAAEFENTYEAPAPTEYQPVAKKTYTNGTLSGNDFVFSLVETDDEHNEIVGESQTVQNMADGSVTFNKITYTEEGTYYYTIKEVVPTEKAENVTYSNAEYYLTVVVTNNDDNELEAEAVYTTADGTELAAGVVPEFINEITLKGKITIKKVYDATLRVAVKVHVYRDADATIDATYADGVTPIGDIIIEPGYTSTAGTYTINGVAFGTYYVYELDNDGNPIIDTTKAADISYVTYKVSYSDDSVVVDDEEEPAVITITNKEVTPGYVTAEGTKTYEGADLEADMFSFKLEEVEKDGTSYSAKTDGFTETVTNDAEGNFEFTDFAELGFAEEGTYYFRVSEVIPSDTEPGSTYDDTVYIIKVVVTYNSTEGKYDAVASIEGSATAITFENSYDAPTPAKFAPEATKIATGFDLEGDDFEFELVEIEGTGAVITGGYTETVKNDVTGKVQFSEIEFDEEGYYFYKIAEVVPTEQKVGFTYSDAVYGVQVHVTYDASTNKYEAEGIYVILSSLVLVDAAEFENTFTDAAPTDYQPVATKVATGFDLTDNQFVFSLVETDDEHNEIVGESQTVQNKADGTVTFNKIDYTASGKYYYTISEVTPTEKEIGISYSDAVYYLVVDVTVNDDNELVPTATYTNATTGTEEAAVFENIYTDATPTEVTPVATKTAEGFTLTDDQFEFELVEIDGTENPITGGHTDSAKNKADGTVTFGKITYTEEGLYQYKIVEKVPTTTEIGYTYSDKAYGFQVVVEKNSDNELVVTDADYFDLSDYSNVEKAEFVNTYTAPDAVEFTPEATKTAVGFELEADQFTFELEQVTDTFGPVPDAYTDTANNAADGTVTFKTIEFTAPAVNYYKITETTGTEEGYTYSQAVYVVKVEVTLESDNTLKVTPTYYSIGTAPAEKSEVIEAEFINTYTKPGTVQFPVTKKVVCTDPDSTQISVPADTFTFTLADEDGNALETITAPASDATAVFEFTEIEYSLSDVGNTYYYTIVENAVTADGYTYDDTVYTIEVTITEEDGKVVATPVILKDTTEVSLTEIEFVNTYTAEDVKFTPVATKELYTKTVAETLAGDEFTFNLVELDKDKNEVAVIDTVTNAADGSVTFNEIVYTMAEAGTYYYKVVEVTGADTGIEYSEDIYYIVAKAEVSTDGEYTLDVKYYLNDSTTPVAEEDVIFTNYNKGEVEVELGGVKVYNGSLADDYDCFGFTLTKCDAAGTLSTDAADKLTTTCKADGTFTFNKLTFDAEGKYYFAIKEIRTSKDASAVIFDSTIYYVMVDVTYDTDAHEYVAEVTQTKDITDASSFVPYDSADIVFTNTATELTVKKVDDEGNPVAGATLTITKKGETTPVKTIVTTTSAETLTKVIVPDTEYVLSETDVPAGYEKADDITFKIGTDNKLYILTNGSYVVQSELTITMVDKIIKSGDIKITKTVVGPVEYDKVKDIIEFTVTNSDTNTVLGTYKLSEFTLVDGKYVLEIKDVTLGNYTVEETKYDVNGYTCVVMHGFSDGKLLPGAKAASAVTVDAVTVFNFQDTYEEVTTQPNDDTSKTGDDAPVMPMAVLFMIGAAGLVVAVGKKKKKEN